MTDALTWQAGSLVIQPAILQFFSENQQLSCSLETGSFFALEITPMHVFTSFNAGGVHRPFLNLWVINIDQELV